MFKQVNNTTLENNATELLRQLKEPTSSYGKYLIFFHHNHLKIEPMKWAIRRANIRIHGKHTKIINVYYYNTCFSISNGKNLKIL